MKAITFFEYFYKFMLYSYFNVTDLGDTFKY